jgi:programmed cell death protein 4
MEKREEGEMEGVSEGGGVLAREVSKSAENLAGVAGGPENRLKKKAKRITRHLSKEGPVPGGPAFVNSPRSWKNNRRPRNGYGRGLPKKGTFIYLNFSNPFLILPCIFTYPFI